MTIKKIKRNTATFEIQRRKRYNETTIESNDAKFNRLATKSIWFPISLKNAYLERQFHWKMLTLSDNFIEKCLPWATFRIKICNRFPKTMLIKLHFKKSFAVMQSSLATKEIWRKKQPVGINNWNLTKTKSVLLSADLLWKNSFNLINHFNFSKIL